MVMKAKRVDGCRALLASLVDNDPAVPSITTARPWAVKPEFCVNLGITFTGMAALGVPPASLVSFPVEYREGAVARAASIGDVGTSAPGQWLRWLLNPGLHLLVVLFAQSGVMDCPSPPSTVFRPLGCPIICREPQWANSCSVTRASSTDSAIRCRPLPN
jgi:hypothetical protein